jgi:hypothetical protein
MQPQSRTAEKILTRLKGLRNHLQAGEEPLFTVPAIWDAGQSQRSTACDVVLTNQRLFGYIFVTFPRERLFLDALQLNAIKAVSLRRKTYEPIFRELLVREERRDVYIRAPRHKIEPLYEALRSAIMQYVPSAQLDLEDEQVNANSSQAISSSLSTPPPSPIYGRQEIRTSFDRSPLAITLLFVGGLLLEILGAVIWIATQSLQTGLPPLIAGLVAVITAIFLRRASRA